MRTLTMSLLLSMLASQAPAAFDVTEPVRDVVEATARNWDEGTTGQVEEVFSPERLQNRFSKDFAEAFTAASKNPPHDLPEGETTGFPFDYDPIAQGQDGCPFKNIRIEDDGDGQVTALFDNRSCFDGTSAADTVLIFHVVEEAGRAVIDDIYPVVEGESGESIKQALKRQGGL
ncbi:hypothetical protein [Peteryoungia ipomoeae]|uniref:Uncharacterized protein n=1 Tax=Peteryoungia ipomoeae TaxID=1210932 RepID=A0A4S8P4I4_9HYPH|nr:hypothetical protein [Peteryoungia ipomoeae]THV24983.1 hypothetical protein FAA97_01885 [Peteryoungia ipomoeae]